MKVEVATSESNVVDTDLLAVPVFEDEALPTAIAECIGAEDVRGRSGDLAVLYRQNGSKPARVAAAGMGRRGELDAEAVRVAAARVEAAARGRELSRIAWVLPVSDEISTETSARALVSGTVLSNFSFEDFKSEPGDQDDGPGSSEAKSHVDIEHLYLVAPDSGKVDTVTVAAESERIAAEAQNFARKLQATPANHLTPADVAAEAAALATAHPSLRDETLGPDEIRALGMGGIDAVSMGSDQPPQLAVLRYSNAPTGSPVLGLVGKTVTFDTGGISLKPPASMPEMKMDMSGGASVLAAVAAIAELELPLNLIAVLPTVENMPSGGAIKPGDVITQYDGTTVEVNNTDAEGRLVLADALTYCAELGATKIVDIATLTGAVLIALGSSCAGTMSNDESLAVEVAEAGAEAGDNVWQLPLNDDYRKLIKGTVADLSNASADRKAGTVYAGAYLEHFVDSRPWVHIDIAGTAWDTGRPYFGNGPTGFGVRLLVNLARRWAEAGK